MPGSKGHALVIGAGIGGLTTAIALQKIGIRVSVYEQAPELGDVGAGLTLQRNANLALADLGLHEAIHDVASLPVRGEIKSLETGETQTVFSYRSSSSSKHNAPTDDMEFRQIHRADFHAILVDFVTRHDPDAIHLNSRFRTLSQTEDTVTAEFENGTSATGDFLVGADGTHSAVRQTLFGPERREFLNFVAWRGLVPTDELPANLVEPDTSSFPGKGRSFIRYKLRQGSLVNYAAFARVSEWTEDGWNVPASVDEVSQEFSGACNEVRTIIAKTPPGSCFKWGLFGRDPLENWTDRRVTLLGDAAHPMLPFLGHGAAMSIEDSLVLARALAASDNVNEGLTRYQNARLNRANLTLLGARHAGFKMHGISDSTSEAAAQGYDEASVSAYDPVHAAI